MIKINFVSESASLFRMAMSDFLDLQARASWTVTTVHIPAVGATRKMSGYGSRGCVPVWSPCADRRFGSEISDPENRRSSFARDPTQPNIAENKDRMRPGHS